MKKSLLALFLVGAFVNPAIAEKPEWAGKGKPTDEQKAAHQAAMEAKEDLDEEIKDVEDKSEELKDLKKDLEKQKAKKSEQAQNELDKGSEQGKSARESNSKKWWKFWGEEAQ